MRRRLKNGTAESPEEYPVISTKIDKDMIGLFKAKRMDNGEEVIGNLIFHGGPFAYILTKENYQKMVVDELNHGFTTCNLIRVMGESIVPLSEGSFAEN